MALSVPRQQRLDADGVIRGIASRQHGVVARRQLMDAGVSGHRIDQRLRTGRLVRLHTGVYGVAPVLAPWHTEMAAVLRCGPGAALSHQTAGQLWDFLLQEAGSREAEPTVVSTTTDVRIRANRRGSGARAGAPAAMGRSAPRPGEGSGAGIRIHRVRRLEVDEVTKREGLPVTTPARTLFDLASCLTAHDLERALSRADRRGLLEQRDLEKLLTRYPRRAGNQLIRALLRGAEELRLTRSEAEALLLDLVREASLPRPSTNVRVNGYEVDFAWRAYRLVVEVDGFEFHGRAPAFERDRQRDGVLIAAGWRVMRVTWKQLTRRPEQVLARLVLALACGPGGVDGVIGKGPR